MTRTQDMANHLAARERHRRVKRVLVGSAVVTLLLYFIPFGRFVAYPLMLLSTLVHELGHGLAALMVGGNFSEFVMYADGSGVARVSGVMPGWRVGFMSAGGLVGPAVVATLCFAVVRWERASQIMVGTLTLGALAALILVVRSAFGFVFVGALFAGLAWLLIRRDKADAQLVLAFLAVQLAVSVFSRGDYLFVAEATTGAGTLPSDVANMATALGGTYWLWGLVCGAFSVLVLAGGLAFALRSPRFRPKKTKAPKHKKAKPDPVRP